MRILNNLLAILGLAAAAALLGTGCASTEQLNHPTTSATLWQQHAAEFEALALQTYQAAESHLQELHTDSSWSAAVEQTDPNYSMLPAAVILDVDETVLSNAAFQARMIKQNRSFDLPAWNNWVMEAAADAISGAVSFTRSAAEKGIAVYYVTNREFRVEEGTRRNLKKLGFPLGGNADRILSKNERSEWTSDKSSRRAHLAEDYRIIMLFGDDLNDFVSAKDISMKQRSKLVDQYRTRWGHSWYVLPNPVYGSWEQALYGFDNSLEPEKIEKIKRDKLNTKQHETDR